MNQAQRAASLIDELNETALEDLLYALSGYGNTIGPNSTGGRAHCDALRSVIETYTRMALGHVNGRIAYPLATGLGKTQSAVAWIRAANQLNAGASVLVCQEQIDSLEDFYRDLTENQGIPARKVGLLLSSPANAMLPSIDPADAGKYPVLLVTHARIKGPRDAEYLNRFNGSERDLVIWDESLIKSQSRCLSASAVSMAEAAASSLITGDWSRADELPTSDLVGYLKRSLRTLKTALHEKRTEPVYMEQRTADEITAYERTLKALLKGNERIASAARETLTAFLAICQFPLRMVYLGEGDRGDGAITYLLTVPESFQRIVILDASCGVRELCQQDDGITMDATHETTAKRFDHLEVTQVVTAGGRSTMGNWRRNSKAIKEYVEYLKTIPSDQAVLTITYKMGSLDKLREKFSDILEDAGIDPKATVTVSKWNDESKRMEFVPMPRFQFISWGMEKAVSRYSYCQHMVALGVLRRNPLELASQVAGQREDLTTALAADRDFIRRVQASEQFYHLQQFIGRGRCREVKNGQAKPATVRLFDQADFGPWIERGLPGATWNTETLVKGKRRVTKTGTLSEVIGGTLSHLPREKTSVSSLKDTMEYNGCPKAFGRALCLALEGASWRKAGRSVVPI